jgi:hypothetical protein
VEPIPGYPLISDLHNGSAVGGLGIEFHSRRRNRVNGKVSMSHGGDGFTIHVDQSFGNCPKYIQARQLRFPPTELPCSRIRPIRHLDRLDGLFPALLTRSDTFLSRASTALIRAIGATAGTCPIVADVDAIVGLAPASENIERFLCMAGSDGGWVG